MGVLNLGYLILGSRDPQSWAAFGGEVLGAMVSSAPNSVALKVDEQPFRILVEQANQDGLTGMGWEVVGSAELESLREQLTGFGLPVQLGDKAGAAKRCVSAYFTAKDPAGNPMEFFVGRTNVGERFVSPAGVSRFVTGDMGLGHVVVPAAGALDETHKFYTQVLGLGDSDDLAMPPPAEGAPNIRVVFMHADNPRHHSLALFNLPVPTGIVHLMLEMENIDEVGRCLDRATAHKFNLMATLGRHCNDNMLSFYVIGPGGISVEVGCEGLQLDWQKFAPTKSTVGDFWGHAYNMPAPA